MALTATQQAKMDELKALIEEMKTTTLQTSPTLSGMYGSYFREEFDKITQKVTEVEQA